MIKKVLTTLIGMFVPIFCFAQTCTEVIGESKSRTYENDARSNTCKVKLVDGRCLRLAPMDWCPVGRVVQLDETKSQIALKQYYAAQQRQQESSQVSPGQMAWEALGKIDTCNRLQELRYSCATAGSYDQCMRIRVGNDYRSVERYCSN